MQFTISVVALFGLLGFAMAAPQGPIGCVEAFNACEAAAAGNANAITQCSLVMAQCETGVAK